MTAARLPGPASVLRVLVVAPALALVAAAMWWVWLGWAPVPYPPPLVVGCGAAVVVATVLARLRATHWSGLLVLPAAAVVGFAWPWSVDAASTDETGLWVVGLVLLLVGGGTGLLVVVAVTDGLRHRSHRARG